jgi:uncharacterized membrane protein
MRTVIAVHIAAAVLSLVLGASILLLRKGTTRHRLTGRVWVAAMFVTVLSSFGIRELNHGQLSWVHNLAVLTALSLVRAIWAIRQGNVRGHVAAMRGSFIGLVVAGMAAVVTPHRALNVMLGGWSARISLAAAARVSAIPLANANASRRASLFTDGRGEAALKPASCRPGEPSP